MTEQQRQQRAAFIREQPVFGLIVCYAVAFLGCSVAIDTLQVLGDSAPSAWARYLMPLIALPMWLGLWGWARRMVHSPEAGSRS